MHVTPITAAAKAGEAMTLTLSARVGRRRVAASVQLPAACAAEGRTLPPLVALHGISRDAAGIAEAFGPICARAGRVLIVPHFSERDWPRFQRIGRVRPDLALLSLITELRALGLVEAGRVALFGYSGGAQLAHRFAMLYPQRIAALHLAAAGWYCMPDETLPFPVGLKSAGKPGGFDAASLALGQLPAFLSLPVRIYVGDRDTARDQALRSDPRIDASQGLDRVSRARRYAAALRDAAAAKGIAPDIGLTELEGCAHSFSECAQAGLTRLVCAR